MSEQFISEPIKPVTETCDTRLMALGSPGLPKEFLWRGKTIAILNVLRSWQTTGACRHGSGEQYVRRYWHEVQTAQGSMKIYFDKGSPGRYKEMGWRLFSIKNIHSKSHM
jgi:hypothetical protein